MLTKSTRKKFIVTTWEGGGSVGPALTVARKLVEAGHDVRVMSDACNRPESEAVGARFQSWTRAPNRTDRNRDSDIIKDWAGASVKEGMTQVLLALSAGRAKDYAEDVIEELRREPADLVIGSELLLGVELGCEVAQQPCVVLACNSIIFPTDGAPQAGPPMSPEQQAELQPVVDQIAEALADTLPVFNAARAHFGLGPLDNMWNQVLSARQTLIGISRIFDFGPATDEGHFAYVGPQIDEANWTDGWQSPWPADDRRPLVLVSFSTTFQNHVAILQRVADALGALPVRAVITLGPTIRQDEIDAPANVLLVESAPHNEVMRQADLLVTHGGHGTVARGLVNHLPMLVLPHGRDQNGNAARVVAHGTGLMLPPTTNAGEIEAALRTLLEDPSFREGARRLGTAVQAEMDQEDIVSRLEMLCQVEVA